MKTYKHLYPRICSFQNLLSAFWKARRHKSTKPDVAAFEFNLERNLLQLEEELLRSSRVRDPAILGLKHWSRTSFKRNECQCHWVRDPRKSLSRLYLVLRPGP